MEERKKERKKRFSYFLFEKESKTKKTNTNGLTAIGKMSWVERQQTQQKMALPNIRTPQMRKKRALPAY